MICAPNPANEDERLATLRAMSILDTGPEVAFDRLTRLAVKIFDVPIAAVSLIDNDREWYKSSCGVTKFEESRRNAFCAHAILSENVLVVEDTLKDKRFFDNPLVTGSENIRFYAGAPIITKDGMNLGAFCLKDQKPRSFSADDSWMLQQFAAIVVDEMESRLLVEKAKAASRAKTEFLTNMSHEIRTPMTSILGFADLMFDDSSSASDRLNSANIIRRNGEHLLNIINDILDISKIEAGKLDIENIAFDPGCAVIEVIELLSERAREKGLLLRLENSSPIPRTIQNDPVRLKQCLVNIIGNAIKFTPKGSVVVRAHCSPSTEKLTIDVIDSGKGISDEQLARLFHPFTQADSTTTRRHGGSGLGLSIAKSLSRIMGGDLEVHSVLNEGSTFSLSVATGSLEGLEFFDTIRRFGIVPEKKSVFDALPTLCGKILLVEDGTDNQRLISFLLRSAGAEVVVANHGGEGVDQALKARNEGRSFDLIFMDMQMPVLDGYEATGVLRENGYSGPIIALTAHAMSGERNKCIEAGCDDYLTKPCKKEILIHTAAEYLGRSSRFLSIPSGI